MPTTPMPSAVLPTPSSFKRSGRESLIFAVQFLLWWAANNSYAVSAHVLLRSSSSRLLFISLSFFQIIIGLATACLFTSFSPQIPSHTHQTPTFRLFLPIGLCHCLGVLLTNCSYSVIGASSTLVWKLTEPLSAAVLQYIFLRNKTTPTSLVGILIVLIGVIFFSAHSLSLPSVSPVIFANIAFPIRNVLVKLQSNNYPSLSTARRYFLIQAASFPFCAVVLLYALFSRARLIESFIPVIKNSILFNIYMFCSIALLEKLDPLTHSMANTLKRFSGIALSFFLLGDPLHVNHILGIILTVLGFPLFVFGKHQHVSIVKGIKGLLRFALLPIYTLGIFSLGVFSAQRMPELGTLSLSSILNNSAEVSTPAMQMFKNASLKDRKTQDMPVQNTENNDSLIMETKKLRTNSSFVVRVLNDHYVEYNISYKSYEEAMKHTGGNVGNYVWQYAAYRVLPDFTSTTTCNETRELCEALHPELTNGGRVLTYRPAANLFNYRLSGGLFKSNLDMLNKYEDLLLYVGVGSQAGFILGDYYNDLRPTEDKITVSPSDLEFPPNAKEYLKGMEERAYPMLLRGNFTRDACLSLGYSHGISVGCPSLMLNADVQLGKRLEHKYEALRSRIGDRSLRIAINSRKETRYHTFFMSILNAYPNSLVYAQGLNDIIPYKRSGLPYHRIRFFTNVHDWKKSLSKMDLAFGGRIHGNLIAVAASIPVFIVAPDYRVLEIAQRMQIPHTTSLDKGLVHGLDVAKFVSKKAFDGAAFDRNRCETAKLYEEVFGRFNIGISSHVKNIARSC